MEAREGVMEAGGGGVMEARKRGDGGQRRGDGSQGGGVMEAQEGGGQCRGVGMEAREFEYL